MDVERARAAQLANIVESTGTSLETWSERIEARRSDGASHGQLVSWLKTDFGLTHGNANALVHESAARGVDGPVDLVAEQYSGGKAGLRPIYDALVSAASGLGDDVAIAPKKTSVSLRRHKQFAVVTPASRARIDLGLNLGDRPPDGRLEAATGMCSHRVRIGDASEVDAEVVALMREAYERAGA